MRHAPEREKGSETKEKEVQALYGEVKVAKLGGCPVFPKRI